tara:strand:+ start:46 stop:510 length:465 start_codon:yes stop_codon:yes gene_type:complete
LLKISKLTDYAIIILRHIVINKKNKYSAATLSEEIKLNTPTVSKLLKLLAKANILTSFRGIEGGYTLIKRAADISMLDVSYAIDGKYGLTDCSIENKEDCKNLSICPLVNKWQILSDLFKDILGAISLEDIININSKSGFYEIVSDRLKQEVPV